MAFNTKIWVLISYGTAVGPGEAASQRSGLKWACKNQNYNYIYCKYFIYYF